MRPISILFVACFVMSLVLPVGAQEQTSTQKTGSATQPEKTKNAVELAIEEAEKRGERILTACLQDCDDDAVLKGKALELPQPAYPPIARAAGVSGTVKVHVIIDTAGNVVAAAAVEGHPLLQAASVAAARYARFTPTLYNGEPVKIAGLIEYNFALQ